MRSAALFSKCIRRHHMLGTVIGFGGLGLVIGILMVPPWNSRFLQEMHYRIGEFSGIWLTQFPSDYTGKMTIWERRGDARQEIQYVNGERHGIWRVYAADGSLESECEYRFGGPWNGWCRIFEHKVSLQ